MKRVFVINGAAGTGKDTFINLTRELFAGNVNVATYSSVDEVKQWLKDNEGWDGITKDASIRFRMHEIKQMMVADNNRPTRYLLEKIAQTEDNSIVFLHIREPEEIAKLLQEYPEAQTIHIDREGIERFDNPADSRTAQFIYDYYVTNPGNDIEQFREVVRQFILQNLNDLIGEQEQMDLGDFK
ncbi:hypothetical protein BAC3_02232 [uncultured bacterium]|nr:hypothetical protein [Candidatus Dojkabacteria bacterium]CAG1771985.1 hypothetical protein BAC3_02232 [uncultured bacterium]